MALSEDFKEAVANNNTTRVRIMIKDNLIYDPSGKEFEEMLKYAKTALPTLMDEHDGEDFKSSDEWDEDYLNELMVTVVSNFSAERLEQLKKMVKKLYGKVAEPQSSKERSTKDRLDKKEGNISGTKAAGACVAVVGTGILIGGLIVADMPIVVPIIGGVAIGVGSYLFFKE